uniref:Uncharacterized protein n=1 Tax=Ursus americanus TaxID=9643 RepID=A0A452QH91_URSAM
NVDVKKGPTDSLFCQGALGKGCSHSWLLSPPSAPPVPQVPALPHEGSPGDQAATLLTARYQDFQFPSLMGSPSGNKIYRSLIWKLRIEKS